MSSNNISNEVYGGAAKFGVLVAYIMVAFATIFSVGFIVSGFKLRRKYSNRSSEIKGIVVNDPDCKAHKVILEEQPRVLDKSITSWNCTNVKVSYTINNEVVNKTFSTDNNRYLSKSDNVIVYFDPDNIGNTSLEKDNRAAIGLIMILAGVAVLIMALIRLYLVRKYKFIAVFGGAATAVDFLF